MLALKALRGLLVIDEVQHLPDVFPVLRVLDGPAELAEQDGGGNGKQDDDEDDEDDE